jgi:ElaB/YqjD/DUF883 family membrane-anchored ribosome-binding protein
MKANGLEVKTSPVIERVAAMAHEAVDNAADAAAPSADWITKRGDALNARQKKLLADTCRYVATNPLKAVGIALVTGALLGRILL